MAERNDGLPDAVEKVNNEFDMTTEELQTETNKDLKNNFSDSNCLVCKKYAEKMKSGESISDEEFGMFVTHHCG